MLKKLKFKIKNFRSISFLFFLGLIFISPNNFVHASNLTDRLSGRILLQVESKGEAWYVSPENKKRYYLGRPSDAFLLMQNLGLGVSNKDFDSFLGCAPLRLSGKILLKAEDGGKAYYVSPADLKMYYLGRPSDAFNLMRIFGLGISNMDLGQIEISDDSEANNKLIDGEEKIVTKVVDGDTVVINGGDHVRLLGVDTDEKNFPCFIPAKNYLENLILGKTVILERDRKDKDQYNRLLRFVHFYGVNINLDLIKNGLAVCRYYEPNEKYKSECAKLEEEAIVNKIGCKWGDTSWTESDSLISGSCLIKGNISYTTKEKIFHAPGCGNYDITQINEESGERWFCTEEEAIQAGWRKAGNCN